MITLLKRKGKLLERAEVWGFLVEVVGIHRLLGSLFSERFTLGPGCLTVDDATTICLMEKPKDLQRWYVLFQFPLQEQLIGLTFQICTSC